MQSKLCLWLAVAVLVGALVGGNPFLPRGTDAPLRAAPAPLPTAHSAAFDLRAVAGEAPRCPEPGLQAHVVAVRYDGSGLPVWVLDDGRQVRRNPQAGPGQPKVVAVGGAAGSTGDAEDEVATGAEGR